MTDRQTTLELLTDLVRGQEAQGRVYSQDFLLWYAEYPRKRAIKDAWKAWQQTAKDRPLVSEMVETLAWQRKSDDWTRDAGRFIPYPASYLRAGHWDDEPAVSAYCPFHRSRRNNGHPNPNGPKEGCPECKHAEARKGTRTSDPIPAAAVVSEVEATMPLQTRQGEAELREDFGRMFPGVDWPGYAEAWRRVAERMRKEMPKQAPPPARREPGEDG